MQTLNLAWNNIGSDGAKALADGLQHCNSLKILNLQENDICSDGAKALAAGLQHCNSLQTLSLEGNNIGADDAKALADSTSATCRYRSNTSSVQGALNIGPVGLCEVCRDCDEEGILVIMVSSIAVQYCSHLNHMIVSLSLILQTLSPLLYSGT